MLHLPVKTTKKCFQLSSEQMLFFGFSNKRFSEKSVHYINLTSDMYTYSRSKDVHCIHSVIGEE